MSYDDECAEHDFKKRNPAFPRYERWLGSGCLRSMLHTEIVARSTTDGHDERASEAPFTEGCEARRGRLPPWSRRPIALTLGFDRLTVLGPWIQPAAGTS